VITGGPGSGKTTVLHELQARGYRCVPEVARQIIQEQMESGGNAVPWGEAGVYADIMMQRSIDSYLENSDANTPTFFDRGIPDTLGYAEIIRLPEKEIAAMRRIANQYRYNRLVFIVQSWKDIYETDRERKQTWEEAIAVYHCLVMTYQQCGYELIELPKVSTSKRADFIEETLQCI
jgi:predicted ATPase